MSQPLRVAVAVLLLGLCAVPAHAQQAPASEAASRRAADTAPDGWSLGLATVYREGVMLGEDARTLVVPTFGYEGERFFLRGISGGVHLLERGGVQLDATLSARLDGWDAEDLDARQLADIGIDRALLRDREIGFDAGLGLVWRGRGGVLGANVKADVSGRSEGFDATVEYGYPIPFGGGLLTPTAQLSYWSDDLADYYYGTLPEEEAAGVPAYRPGSAVVPGVGVRWLKPFAQRWVLVAGVQHQRLDDALTDSPLVDDDADGLTSVFLGLSRRFGGER